MVNFRTFFSNGGKFIKPYLFRGRASASEKGGCSLRVLVGEGGAVPKHSREKRLIEGVLNRQSMMEPEK